MRRLAAGAFLSGCAYSFAESPAAGARTLRLVVFENPTRDRGLEARLAKALARELGLDGRLRLVSEGGELVLTGSILRTRRGTLFRDKYGDAVERKFALDCSVDLLDTRDGRYVLKGRKVSSEEADPAAGIWDMRRGEYFGLAESAVAQLARAVARLVLLGW